MDEKYLKFIFDSVQSLPNNPDRESLDNIKKKLNLLGGDCDLETIEKVSILKSKGYTREAGGEILKDKTLNEIKGLEDLSKDSHSVIDKPPQKKSTKKPESPKKPKQKIERVEQKQPEYRPDSGSKMKKVSDYRIIGETHVNLLEKKVNNAVNQGWTPLGGVCIYAPGPRIGGAQDSCFQAIVKYS